MGNTQSVNNSDRNSGVNRPVEKQASRPTSAPKSDKDFKKILDDDEEDGNEVHANRANIEAVGSQSAADEREMAEGEANQEFLSQNKSKFSLFDLSANRNTTAPKKSESPFGVFSKSSAKVKDGDEDSLLAVNEERPGIAIKEEKSDKEEVSESTERSSSSKKSKVDADTPNTFHAVGEKDKDSKKEGGSEGGAGFGKGGQPDASYMNAMAANQAAAIEGVSHKKDVVVHVDMDKLIKQLVAQAYELRQDGKTETTVVLKEPPMFAGASIVITGFDSARGQFNLSFQNLTQAAKNILDMQVNQDSLKAELDKSGYGVHIIVTTTQIETPIVTDSARPDSQREQKDRENQNRDRDGRGSRNQQR